MTHTASTLMPFFGLIRVSGEDRASFLHNQLSNDINHLPAGQACLATYNTAKGRVIANIVLLNRGEDIILIAAADLCEILQKKLQIYIMRSKVKLECMAEWGAAVSVPTSTTAPTIPAQPQYVLSTTQTNQIWQITLPDNSTIQIGKINQLPPLNTETAKAWQAHEINSGNPWISAATTETCVAQMLNQQLIGAVHFKKGCYPGQEIIARAQYRGQVKRGLVLIETTSALSTGATITDSNNEEIGLIVNQVQQGTITLALAVIKHSAAEIQLQYHNHPIDIKKCFFTTAITKNI
jgi:tRNA-modifying protein YgfZ